MSIPEHIHGRQWLNVQFDVVRGLFYYTLAVRPSTTSLGSSAAACEVATSFW
ncbi:MAG TPA: hypothetical protein VLL08_02175 [Kineosporiaceae bacterium]|nr:hypothetical protein [Kineosporiaceae bacterium]